ncbi:MAG: tetratricopeptide repeat protein, partial [Pseudomonadota bacterium]
MKDIEPDTTSDADSGVFSQALARARALLNQSRAAEAAEVLHTALTFQPGDRDGLTLLAQTLGNLGRLEEAEQLLARMRRMFPDDANIGALHARTLFWMGEWDRAWRAYRVRFALMDTPPRVYGSDAAGNRQSIRPWMGDGTPERLFVMSEQGLGDVLQFCRFAAHLHARGIEVSIAAPDRLTALLKTMETPVNWLSAENPAPGGAPTRTWLPMLDIPMALGLSSDDYSAPKPYLFADPARPKKWRAKMKKGDIKIGIAWQGNPEKDNDRERSATLETFAPLADIPGVQLYALQVGDAADAVKSVPFKARITTFGKTFDKGDDAFLDTAAVMMELDRIVTVDTAIGHLAGALGRPVSILLSKYNSDWRWQREQRETLWYPTATLHRQSVHNDWSGPMAEIAAEIAAEFSGRTGDAVTPHVPVSVGEMLDKMSILTIKTERIKDKTKLANVKRELEALDE